MTAGLVLYAKAIGNVQPHLVLVLGADGTREEGAGYSNELAVGILIGCGLTELLAKSNRPASQMGN